MLGAAERRWDNEGRYTWHLCPSVGEDLSPASSSEIIGQHFSMFPDHTPPPPSGPAPSGSPKATIPTDTCDPSSPSIAPQQPNLADLDQLATDFNYDMCPKCQEKTVEGSCIWCSFTNMPQTSPSISSQNGLLISPTKQPQGFAAGESLKKGKQSLRDKAPQLGNNSRWLWWVCHGCSQINNPALSPGACFNCGHSQCEYCSNLV
jgi:hypothetical protein